MKARNEILDELNGKDDLAMEDLKLVPYTTAFVNECLRLYTAIPFDSRLTDVDVKFGKYTIPKGTPLMMPFFIQNKDEESFDDAHKFIPERYLDDSKYFHYQLSYQSRWNQQWV